MKWLSTYMKEMKIAYRGFYFYIEIVVAFIILTILLVAVKENPDSKAKEYLFYDMPSEAVEYMLGKEVEKGNVRIVDDTTLKLKPISFIVLNKKTGLKESFVYSDEKMVKAKVVEKLNKETGQVTGTMYILENKEDMIRLSNNTSNVGATIIMDKLGNFFYEYYLQGYETERYDEVLYVLHTFSRDDIKTELDSQITRKIGDANRLNSREAFVPVFITFSGVLMGFFIIMSYIFLDKSQGVIKAFAVTPSSVWNYLLIKTFVILTTVLISSSIIVIPIMKFKPNYLLFYIFLSASTFAFSCFGLLVASYFDTISKSFGVLYLIMIFLMVPIFSYYIGSFDPIWIRFLPTYPILEGFRSIMRGQSDVGYVLIYSLVFLVSGVVLLVLADMKFKKSLTV